MEDNDWGQIFGFQAHHVTMIFDGTLKCRNDLNELKQTSKQIQANNNNMGGKVVQSFGYPVIQFLWKSDKK